MTKRTGYIVAAFAVMVALAASSFKQQDDLAASIKRGKDVYTLYCQNCHSADGTGQTGMYPPLAKADYLKRPDKELINIILNGQSGQVTVNDTTYDDDMQPLSYLTDVQVADVLNYAKNSWGNQSTAAIKPDSVKAARQ